MLTHLNLSKTYGISSIALPFVHLQMRKLRLRKHQWFSQGQTTNQQSKTRVCSYAEKLQNNHCTRLPLIKKEKRNQICMVIKGLERKMRREKGDMVNPKKERCHTLQENGEEGTNESNGKKAIGVFRLGRLRSGSLVIRYN